MSKHWVDCQDCGTEYQVNLDGNRRQREWKLENWTWICPDCKAKAWEEKKNAENEASAAANREAGLPTLTGTEKQIAWAETLRAQKMAETKEIEVDEDQQAEFDAMMRRLTAKAEAKWWIDNRSQDIVDILYSVADDPDPTPAQEEAIAEWQGETEEAAFGGGAECDEEDYMVEEEPEEGEEKEMCREELIKNAADKIEKHLTDKPRDYRKIAKDASVTTAKILGGLAGLAVRRLVKEGRAEQVRLGDSEDPRALLGLRLPRQGYKPASERKSAHLGLRVTEGEMEQIKEIAAARSMRHTDVARQWIEEGIKKEYRIGNDGEVDPLPWAGKVAAAEEAWRVIWPMVSGDEQAAKALKRLLAEMDL